MKKKRLFILFLLCLSIKAFSTTWHVGSTQAYTIPSQVKDLVADGDTVLIDGGTYSNDATKWNKRNLVFIGLGSSNDRTILQYTGDIPNGKGIFVFETPGICDNPYIDNIVFDGAQVSDSNGANGAGIRFQAKDITIVHCEFRNCQNGILEGHASVNDSNVVIRNTEFNNNGYQLQNDPNYSGYEHHVYISASVDTLMVYNCYFHHPRGQANSIKTRAQRSFILYNKIDEEDTGYGSWELNIAQGGLSIIMGNVFIQGSSGVNHGMVGYDAATNPLQDFYFVNNTIVNRYNGNVKYFNVVPSSGINTFKIYNNIFSSIVGASTTFLGSTIPSTLDSSNNIISNDYLNLGFTDPANSDFSLLSSAIQAIDHGVNAGNANTNFLLTPLSMYADFTGDLLPRNISGSSIDIGAYEFESPSSIVDLDKEQLFIYPNPSNAQIHFQIRHFTGNGMINAHLISPTGMEIFSKTFSNGSALNHIDIEGIDSGWYLLEMITEKGVYIERVIVEK